MLLSGLPKASHHVNHWKQVDLKLLTHPKSVFSFPLKTHCMHFNSKMESGEFSCLSLVLRRGFSLAIVVQLCGLFKM